MKLSKKDAEARKIAVLNALNNNTPIPEIAKIVGFSTATIRKIKSDLLNEGLWKRMVRKREIKNPELLKEMWERGESQGSICKALGVDDKVLKRMARDLKLTPRVFNRVKRNAVLNIKREPLPVMHPIAMEVLGLTEAHKNLVFQFSGGRL